MKKFLALLLLLTMLSTCALADTALTDCAIANGNVTATTFVDVTAPYSGTLASFATARIRLAPPRGISTST